MDFTALFIIIIGIILIMIGIRGTYGKIWSSISPASGTASTTGTSTSAPSTGIPTGAPGQGQIP